MDTYDHLQRRCPRLGSDVTFQYCRESSGSHLPCFKIADCWWERFDIMAYLHTILSEEDVSTLMTTRPKDKVLTLVELIAQAKNNTDT